jgi:DNA-binding response OmpR family regulator
MKILLAEDDIVTSTVVKEQLQQWGYEVFCAYNGNDAWQALNSPDAPKMVVLDWQMPGLSGLELCRKLRALKTGSYVYVVMLTSLDEKIHVVQGLEAGADDYLSKPCNPHELKVRLLAGQRILNLESELLATMKQLKEVMTANRNSNLYNSKLTGREMDVLRLIVSGKTDEEVARTFHMSPDWVSAYMVSIMEKLEVQSREKACEKAIQDGILPERILL